MRCVRIYFVILSASEGSRSLQNFGWDSSPMSGVRMTICMAIPTPMMPDFKGGPVVFLKEVKAELAKVIWPTRADVIKLTVVVVVVSFVIGVYVGGLDLIFTKLTDILVQR